MSERRVKNWITAYLEYAGSTEAPRIIHFWAAVSAVGGALRRRVWFDQVKFQWYPSFYIVFVGPPGIITKSTTADGSMDLLKAVPGIHFGPDSITWQRMVTAFAEACESFEFEGNYIPMSAVTYVASEFGNLIDFNNPDLINLLITLWDGRKTYGKETKFSGNDAVEGPWINILGCTTPRWIKTNMNENTIGGGFTSRCIFVYGDKKERPIAYIKNAIKNRKQYDSLRDDLIHDLEWMATQLVGPYELTPEAEEWGTKWYEDLWANVYSLDNEDYVNNYLARKQAHMHKLALVMAAAQRDERIITLDDLRLSEIMLNQTETDFKKVFRGVGATEEGMYAQRLLEALQQKHTLPYKEFIKLAQLHFPSMRDFEGVFAGFIRAGQVELRVDGGEPTVRWIGDPVEPPTPQSPL